MKLSIEVTPDQATKTLELNGKKFSEVWVREPLGYGTTGPGIESQIESEYGEEYDDNYPGLCDLLDAIDEQDVSDIIDAFSGVEEDEG